ncbi:hypothetical protein [Agromyces soli]|uniref:Modulator of FtsH protease n=1 Tax=Agromyces soli TaxID=659012 RepID=A0ABY4API2_9MICO|nr:hypothetical protein [Agromyces soli]UOE24784.1 hypothetical protein MTP13_10445 [Agromyces soli]
MPELREWAEFNVAMVGATAALAGLLIVAMSVNIARITGESSLTARIAGSLATLVLAIVTTGLAIAPAQPARLFGLEVLLAALAATAFQVHAVRSVFADRAQSPTFGVRFGKSIAGVLPLLAYLAGALLIVIAGDGGGGAGLWLLAAGTLLAIAASIVHAWVVLVEVLR